MKENVTRCNSMAKCGVRYIRLRVFVFFFKWIFQTGRLLTHTNIRQQEQRGDITTWWDNFLG